MFGTMLCLLQRFAVWWFAPPWPILSVAAVLLALCRLVVFDRSGTGEPLPRTGISRENSPPILCILSCIAHELASARYFSLWSCPTHRGS